ELARAPAEGVPGQVRLRSRRARGPQGVDVDLLVPVDALEDWALRTRVIRAAFGRRVRIVSAQALLLLKLRVFVEDPESPEAGQHRADASRILRGTEIDLAALDAFLVGHRALRAALRQLAKAQAPRGRRLR